MKVAVVVGNPKPASRTLDAATMLANKLVADAELTIVDVVELGGGLVGWGDQRVQAAIGSVRECPLAIFASPTYKASYTGLLKTLLDLMPVNGLQGVVAVPLMLGAAMGHLLAPEVFLKPVLVELGATCPTKGLYLLDSQYAEGAAMDEWCDVSRPQIFAAIGTYAN